MQVTPVTLRSASVPTVSAGPSLAEAFVAAAEAIGRVSGGESLNTALADLKHRASAQTLGAAAQDLCYNALRSYGVVDVALERLLQRPLTDSPVRGLLLTALAELAARPKSAHAVVHQAVEAATLLGYSRAKGLVNAVMRNFQRRMPELLSEIEATESGRYRHPQWWIDELRLAYPREWESVLLESNRHPPMVLRVNRRRLSRNSRAGARTGSGTAREALPGRTAPGFCSRRGLGAGRGRSAGRPASGCSRRNASAGCLRGARWQDRTPA